MCFKKIDPHEPDPKRRDTKTGLSMVCRLLQKQLKLCCIGAGMAGYVILFGERFHFSCPFANCVLYLYLQYLLKPHLLEVTVKKTGKVSENITEYSHRHEDLDWCSLFEWKKHFSVVAFNRIKKPKQAKNLMKENGGRHPNGIYFLFTQKYRKYESHLTTLNKIKHIPVIVTYRLPDYNTIYEGYENSKDYNKNNINHVVKLINRRKYYAQFVLIIFFQWRHIKDFSFESPENIDWWSIFLNKLNNGSIPFWVSRILRNFQSYFDAFQIDVEKRPDIFPMNVDEIKAMEKDQQDTKNNIEECFQSNLDIDEILIEQTLAEIADKKNLNSRNVRLINKIKNSAKSLKINFSDAVIAIDSKKYENFNVLSDYKILEEKDIYQAPLKYYIANMNKRDTKAILVSVRESMGNIKNFKPVEGEPDKDEKIQYDDFPKIVEHALKWRLGKDQYPVYCILCLTFFSELISSSENMRSFNSDLHNKIQKFKKIFLEGKPANMIIVGDAGCGKSRIIKAFLHFAKLWQCRDRIGCFTPTGKVAALLREHNDAGTWQSKLGITKDKNKALSEKKLAYNTVFTCG